MFCSFDYKLFKEVKVAFFSTVGNCEEAYHTRKLQIKIPLKHDSLIFYYEVYIYIIQHDKKPLGIIRCNK